MTDFSRRDFLRASALAAAGVALNPDFTPGLDAAGGPATGWDAVPGILKRIRPPVFPARDFPITQFGAVANDHVAHLKDIGTREALVLGAFAAGVLLVGVWPAPLLALARIAAHSLLSSY